MNIVINRNPLANGTILCFGNEQCLIDKFIGSGTSSIVYEATLDGRKIVLKELYPKGLSIFRDNDNSLISTGASKNVFEYYKKRWQQAFQTQLEIYNDEKTNNYTVEPQKLYKLNNTLYIVMHLSHGCSYDKVTPKNILSVLETIRALSCAVHLYHRKKLLLLDIKPHNFFVFPETDQIIQLFDFDSVMHKNDIRPEEFSYSTQYAAPEIILAAEYYGSYTDIDERSDIFSIGAVTFEKIMGRNTQNEDLRKNKIWHLNSNKYFEDVVPQLQNGITEIFQKTLAINKNDRYSSVKELIDDLDRLIKLARVEVYFKNQNISPCTSKNIYVSRTAVCEDIYKRLNQYHILYLYAIRGSGKSETAREYAEIYANKYDFIQSVFYSDNLKRTIANLDFVGLKDEDRLAQNDQDVDRLYSYKLGLLGNTNIYGTNTLLIIDNYDYNPDPTSNEYQKNFATISKLQKLHIHIIFTTRINPPDQAHIFKLEDMSKSELEQLFFKVNPIQKDDLERKKLVDNIIEVAYYHTMTIKLIALQSKKYKKSLEEYLSVLKEHGMNSHIQGRITNEKDDESITMSAVYDHIKALFDFDNLSKKEKYVMVNACLLPLEGLDTTIFSNFINLDNFDNIPSNDCTDDCIEDLANSGWIIYTDHNEKKISLHPLICDIVSNELNPELIDEKCRNFYISFLDLISEWGNDKIEKSDFNKSEKLVCSLSSQLDKVFKYKKIFEAINYIIVHNKSFYIQNYAIISNNEIITYFGIDKKIIIEKNISNISSGAFSGCSFLEEILIMANITKIENSAFCFCSSLTDIVIPNSVIEIGDSAFYECISLTKIVIPGNVTTIGTAAFQLCSALKEIIIPNSVIQIGGFAFSGCSSLTKISLPNSIHYIGFYIFADCSSLPEINIPNSISEIGFATFIRCSSIKEIKISSGVTKIEACAFEGCSSLLKINIPNSVTQIGDYAFASCSSLLKINIPNSVTQIGNYAFSSCFALKQIIIPDSLTQIGDCAFYDCPLLSQIVNENGSVKTECEILQKWPSLKYFPNNATRTEVDNISNNILLKKITILENMKKIEDGAFYNYSSLKKIIIPQDINIIGNAAFKLCSALKEIIIPNSVTKIGNYAFSDCSSLTEIVIPNSVIEMGDSVFDGCSSLTKIIISDNITKIGDHTFSDCSSLTQITIPNNITEIGNYTFFGCSSLTEIVIPNNVIEMGDFVFDGCSSLTKIIISDNITKIGDHTFSDCSSLTQIIIPNDITEIGNYAFFGCSSLIEIVISNNVIEMGDFVFDGCSSLTRITISDNITKIGDHTFSDCSSLTQITIPDSITKFGNFAFYNCSSLTEIVIPNSVIDIGDDTFDRCSSLTKIVISDNINEIGNYTFQLCSALKEIIIPDSVTKIGNYAFAGCSLLTQIAISENMITIGKSAFINCISLNNIIIPRNVKNIKSLAFFNCVALNKITILSKDVEFTENSLGYLDLAEDKLYKIYKKNEELVIKGYIGSTSEKYAKDNGFKFVAIDKD